MSFPLFRLSLILGVLGVPVHAAQDPPTPLKVSAVQFRSSNLVSDNLKRMTETIERLADEHVNVAVFPECALTGYNQMAVEAANAEEVAAAESQIADLCRRRHIAAIYG